MKVAVHPGQSGGSVVIPPSKSMSHRAIICAALAQGVSHVSNIAFSEDILATIAGMELLGAKIERHQDSVTVRGIDGFGDAPAQPVHCRESGSTLRFFIPIFSLCRGRVRFTGSGRLPQRPQTVYEAVYKEQGLHFVHGADYIEVEGPLKSGEYLLDGNVSSQFITGLLFVLPLLEGDSVIRIKPPLESRSYILLTLQAMRQFGVEAYFEDDLTLRVPGSQCYKACDTRVEGDYSQLAFFAVLGAISGDLEVRGVLPDSLQGDKAVIEYLQKAGAVVETLEDGFLVRKSNLKGCEMDLADCPDLGPVLTVMAACAEGESVFRNAGRLRIKECDRIAAMEQELRNLGVDIRSNEDTIWVKGGPFTVEGPVSDHNDHRIVMAMSVAASRADRVLIIEGAQAINKSYPAFFEDLARAGIESSELKA